MNCGCSNSITGASYESVVNNIIAGDNITLTPNGNLKSNSVTISAEVVPVNLGNIQVSEGLSVFPSVGDLSAGNVTISNTGQKTEFCYLFKTNKSTEGGRSTLIKQFDDNERYMILDGYESKIASQLANDYYIYTNSGVSFQNVGVYYVRASVSFLSGVQNDNIELGLATSLKGEFDYKEANNYNVININHVLSNETVTLTIEGVLIIDNSYESVATILIKSSTLSSENISILSQTLYINYIGLNITQEPDNYPTNKYIRNADTFINFVKGFNTLTVFNQSKIDNTAQFLTWSPDFSGRWNSDTGALGGKYCSFNPTHRLISNYILVEPNSDYTIMFWARFPTNTAPGPVTNTIIGNNTFNISLIWLSSLSYLSVKHNTTLYQSTYAIPTSNIWNHYTITFDRLGGGVLIYMNGIFVASGINQPNFTADTNNEGIGHRNDGALGDDFYFGDLAAFEIWNNIKMSDTQVLNHYASQERLID